MGLSGGKTKFNNIVELVGVLSEIGCYVVQDFSNMLKIFNPESGGYPGGVMISPYPNHGPIWYEDDSVNSNENKKEYDQLIEKITGFDFSNLDISKYGLVFKDGEKGVDFLTNVGYESVQGFKNGFSGGFLFKVRAVDAIIPKQRDRIWYPKINFSVKPIAVGIFHDGALAFINGYCPMRKEEEPMILEHHQCLREAYAERVSR